MRELTGLSGRSAELLIGKSLPYVALNFVVAMFYFLVLFPLNNIPVEGSWLVIIPFTFVFILAITTWGMWMSALCKTRLFATQALMFLAMPSFVLSGFTWPRQAMPWFMRLVGSCLPLTYFVNSFRNIYLAAAPVKYIATDFFAMIGFLCVNIVVALWAIRKARHVYGEVI